MHTEQHLLAVLRAEQHMMPICLHPEDRLHEVASIRYLLVSVRWLLMYLQIYRTLNNNTQGSRNLHSSLNQPAVLAGNMMIERSCSSPHLSLPHKRSGHHGFVGLSIPLRRSSLACLLKHEAEQSALRASAVGCLCNTRQAASNSQSRQMCKPTAARMPAALQIIQ